MSSRSGMRLISCALALVGLVASANAQRGSSNLDVRFERRGVNLTLGLRRPACAPARVWIDGHWTSRVERVWVEGCERRVWVEPCWEWRWDSCGRRVQVQVRAGYWRSVRDPGRFENREVRVWVPGCWRDSAPRY